MIYVISKSTFGSYNVRDIQCNANWDCCPYSDYALIPDSMVDGILATQGYCDITLNSAGTEVTGFTARSIPSVPEECCGTNTVLSVNGVKANTDGAVTLTPQNVGAAPAGYGLGSEAHFINDCNEAILNGWYTASDAMNTPEGFTYGWLFVSVRAGGYTRQDYYTCNTSPGHFERYRIDDVWGEWVEISKSAFAPSGYGLGSHSRDITDWNEAIQNGWYRDAVGAANSPFPDRFTIGFVTNYENDCVQNVYSRTSDWEGSVHVLHATRAYDGDANVWGEWEFANPRMEIGVEYRTTERYNGKPVYVKRTGSVQLPASSTRSISYCGDENIKATPVSIQPIYTATYAAEPVELAGIPTFVEKVWPEADIYGGGVVYFKSNSYTDNDHGYDAGSATVSAIVKYIKEVVS